MTNPPEFSGKCAYHVDEIIFQQDREAKHTKKIVENFSLRRNRRHFSLHLTYLGKAEDLKLKRSFS